jgi:hypothetical protein
MNLLLKVMLLEVNNQVIHNRIKVNNYKVIENVNDLNR